MRQPQVAGQEETLELSAYQVAASTTSTLRLGGPQGAVSSMLGLASETGSILNSYKKYLRDGIDLGSNREQLKEELGDLLWYAAAIATSMGLDLDDIATSNLERVQDRYDPGPEKAAQASLPVFDANFSQHEQFPRRLTIEFVDAVSLRGQLTATMRLVSVRPDRFPDGPVTTDEGKVCGFRVGAELGDPLTDNTRNADAYRFHDAIHLGFMAVLGWSPNMRALLRLKRRSDAEVDECEDGARAIFAEEGLAVILSRMAIRRNGFMRETTVDSEIIQIAQVATHDLEPARLPGWLWRRAIAHGFSAMSSLAANGGGFLVADLDERALSYHKICPH